MSVVLNCLNFAMEVSAVAWPSGLRHQSLRRRGFESHRCQAAYFCICTVNLIEIVKSSNERCTRVGQDMTSQTLKVFNVECLFCWQKAN